MHLKPLISLLMVIFLSFVGKGVWATDEKAVEEIRVSLSTQIDYATLKPHSAQFSPENRIRILEKRRIPGPFPRQRNPEITSRHLVVIGFDEYGQEVDRIIVTDPRLIRAEVFDTSGAIQASAEIYRQNVEFSFVLPEDPHIHRLRFFHPRWTGKVFNLEIIGETYLAR